MWCACVLICECSFGTAAPVGCINIYYEAHICTSYVCLGVAAVSSPSSKQWEGAHLCRGEICPLSGRHCRSQFGVLAYCISGARHVCCGAYIMVMTTGNAGAFQCAHAYSSCLACFVASQRFVCRLCLFLRSRGLSWFFT